MVGVGVTSILQEKIASKFILGWFDMLGVGVTQYPEYIIDELKSGVSEKQGDLPFTTQSPPKLLLKHHSSPLK